MLFPQSRRLVVDRGLLSSVARQIRVLSTQSSEAAHVPNPSTSQAPDIPCVLGDTSSGSGDHVSDGRSSETTSTALAGDDLKELVYKVLQVYECKSMEEQRRLIMQLYSPDAIYENNVTLITGRDAIIKRFALLPATTSSVRVEYDPPVVLGATTSAPDVLDDLAHKGDLQVEVQNRQHYLFDRAHSLWRSILLPKGDPELSVLSRLTLSRTDHKVLYHRDMWMHNSQWWGPLQRCWGVVEQAAASTATSNSGSQSSSSR
eukprot:gene11785-11930_t